MIKEDVAIRREDEIRNRRRLRIAGMLVLSLFGIVLLYSVQSTIRNQKLPNCYEALANLPKFDIPVQTCEWIIAESDEDNLLYRVVLHVNGQPVAEIDISWFSVAGIPEFSQSPYNEGWGTFIHVMDDFQNKGLGELMWLAGDQYIKSQFGRGEVRIYIDASINNPSFAQKIRQQVRPVFVSIDGDFVYLIR